MFKNVPLGLSQQYLRPRYIHPKEVPGKTEIYLRLRNAFIPKSCFQHRTLWNSTFVSEKVFPFRWPNCSLSDKNYFVFAAKCDPLFGALAKKSLTMMMGMGRQL